MERQESSSRRWPVRTWWRCQANQDSRHVGYLQYERTFGARDSVPIRGTGRERNQVLDAGDVLALLY